MRAQVETGNVHWDVVDLEIADAVSGCDEGILEQIDTALLAPAPDGTPALRDFLPDTLLECGVGTLLVFILAIGYYITPALVGGQSGQLISNFIAYHMQTSLNWGLAGALGGILLMCVAALYLLYDRVVGVERLRLG